MMEDFLNGLEARDADFYRAVASRVADRLPVGRREEFAFALFEILEEGGDWAEMLVGPHGNEVSGVGITSRFMAEMFPDVSRDYIYWRDRYVSGEYSLGKGEKELILLLLQAP